MEQWLATMRAAWINADLEAIKVLFAKTTEYYETPFYKPAINTSEILELWIGVNKQIIKRLDFTILAIDGDTAIIHWIFEHEGASFDGIYQIKFNDNNDCIFFKAWEMEK